MTRSTIMERVAAGTVIDQSTVDAENVAWCDADDDIPLWEWLGMTQEEHQVWGEHRWAIGHLKSILTARASAAVLADEAPAPVLTALSALAAALREVPLGCARYPSDVAGDVAVCRCPTCVLRSRCTDLVAAIGTGAP